MPKEFPVITNLCYIINDKNQVLLSFKKRGVGAGKWNGPGGKAAEGESVEQSAKREVKEETGLSIKNLEPRGYIEFICPSKPHYESRCYIFIIKDYLGDLIETEECRSGWFSLDNLPFNEMWDNDKVWLPQALSGKDVYYRFYISENDTTEKYEAFLP